MAGVYVVNLYTDCSDAIVNHASCWHGLLGNERTRNLYSDCFDCAMAFKGGQVPSHADAVGTGNGGADGHSHLKNQPWRSDGSFNDNGCPSGVHCASLHARQRCVDYHADAVGQLSKSVGLTMGDATAGMFVEARVCFFKCGIP
jgi:hypothetical protein